MALTRIHYNRHKYQDCSDTPQWAYITVDVPLPKEGMEPGAELGDYARDYIRSFDYVQGPLNRWYVGIIHSAEPANRRGPRNVELCRYSYVE